jgi:type IV secretory pathway TrbL component
LSPFAFVGYFWYYLNIFPLHRQFEFHYLIQLI